MIVHDHYLPKAIYPFKSINFKNPVPACHHCNGSYKTSKNSAHVAKDPAGAAHRRAVFNPYTSMPHKVQLQVSLQHSDISKLAPTDISLQFGPAGYKSPYMHRYTPYRFGVGTPRAEELIEPIAPLLEASCN